jgi:nucleotide-binding universal stress UspA family protein
MALKNLVVYVDARPASAARVAFAARLAARHEAHLAGVHLMWVRALRESGHPPFARVNRMLHDAAVDRAAAARRLFDAGLAAAGLADGGASAEWRAVRVDSIRDGIMHARHADLAVIGQADPADHDLVPELPAEDLLLGAGRPILVVPTGGGPATLGQTVVIAWNASREATRAVNDALPLLERARSVTVLTVDARPGAMRHGAEPGADIAVHLARHGLTVTVEQAHAEGHATAATILERAAARGADLIVMGGYGRSRLRDIVLGGVSHALLQHARVPVLLSH